MVMNKEEFEQLRQIVVGEQREMIAKKKAESDRFKNEREESLHYRSIERNVSVDGKEDLLERLGLSLVEYLLETQPVSIPSPNAEFNAKTIR